MINLRRALFIFLRPPAFVRKTTSKSPPMIALRTVLTLLVDKQALSAISFTKMTGHSFDNNKTSFEPIQSIFTRYSLTTFIDELTINRLPELLYNFGSCRAKIFVIIHALHTTKSICLCAMGFQFNH